MNFIHMIVKHKPNARCLDASSVSYTVDVFSTKYYPVFVAIWLSELPVMPLKMAATDFP